MEILARSPKMLSTMQAQYFEHLNTLLSDKQTWTDATHRCVLDLLSS